MAQAQEAAIGALDCIRDVLRSRRQSGYMPGAHSDNEHLALVIEGGGMRGVAAGGMVSALEDLGLTRCFDSIHGSSAGAAAGAYFACGQANFGTRMFHEDLVDGAFIDLKRPLSGRAIMDADYLVDVVMHEIKPIDFPKLSTAPRLHIVTTDIDTGDAVTFDRFPSYAHYRACLKASVTIPFIAGGPRSLAARRLMDGGLVQQIAVESALLAGATRVLALQTRRRDEELRPEHSPIVMAQAAGIQAMYGGRLGRIYRARNRRINESVALLNGTVGPDGQILFGVKLDPTIRDVHRLTTSPEVLRHAGEISKRHLTDLIDPT